jgi:hypothetical protein
MFKYVKITQKHSQMFISSVNSLIVPIDIQALIPAIQQKIIDAKPGMV